MADNITINTNDMQKLSKAMLHVEKATGKSMYSINKQAMFFALQSAAKATPPGTRASYNLTKKHKLRPLVSLKSVNMLAYQLPNGKIIQSKDTSGRLHIYQADNGKIFSTNKAIRERHLRGAKKIKEARKLTKAIKMWDKKANTWKYIPYAGEKRDESEKIFKIPGAGAAKRGWLGAMGAGKSIKNQSGKLYTVSSKHNFTEDYISVTDKVEYTSIIAPEAAEIGIKKATGRLVGSYKKKLEKIGTDFNQFK
jgi:hypothetical protein